MKNLGGYAAVRKELTNSEKDELIRRYAVLVRVMAYRVAGRMPPLHEIEDMISAGTVGLLEAIESFDPAVGVKFETYAKFRIRGAIIDDVRYRDWIPRSVRSKLKELSEIERRLGSELDHLPNDQDMARALGMDLEAYYDYVVSIQPAGMLSYSDLGLAKAAERTVLEFFEDKTVRHPDFEVQLKEIKTKIIEALETLDQDEQLSMSLYYYEGLTFKEIGAVIGVSESRASQVHAKAIAKLQWRLKQYRDDISTLETASQIGGMNFEDK